LNFVYDKCLTSAHRTADTRFPIALPFGTSHYICQLNDRIVNNQEDIVGPV
jgi:hypothetical protein